jgi:spore germination protein KA
MRWVKYFAAVISVLLPAFYLVAALHNPGLLNSNLILILAKAERNIPFSLLAETVGILVMYEIIREAGIRLPKIAGGAVSIVAGLIIGDAAVRSGFISTPLLTVVALSVISGFIIPELHQPATILRLVFAIAAGFFGISGIAIVGILAVLNLCSSQAFGYPVTAPIAPFSPKFLRDIVKTASLKSNKHFNVSTFTAKTKGAKP